VDSGLPDMLLSSKLTCHVLDARNSTGTCSKVAPRSLHGRSTVGSRLLDARSTLA